MKVSSACAPIDEPTGKDTDGFFARHFDRKISGAISRVLLKTPVTPNQITIGVTLVGVAAGACLAQPGKLFKIFGALLFLASSILDGCDGEVARAKNKISALGGWLDLWGDNVVHVAVFGGIAWGLYQDFGNSQYLFLGKVAVAATVGSALVASLQMIRQGQSSFVSVAGNAEASARASGLVGLLTRLSDALARRDFVYAVPVVVLAGWLPAFLWVCAVGASVYFFVLVILFLSTTRSA